MAEKLIAFRADGNVALGSGHVMRCMSIAAALQKQGAACCFITADDAMHSVIEQRGFTVHSLDTVWDAPDGEREKLARLLAQLQPSCIVVDHYYVTADYLGWLQGMLPTAYVDDFHAFESPVSLLVDYNLYAPDSGYVGGGAGQPQQLLIGTRYAPLREEFTALSARPVRAQAADVLISTGGSDPLGIAPQLLRAQRSVAALREVTLHVVAGALNPCLDELRALEAACPNVRLYTNVQRMSELMCACDAAVAAAGGTLYELCACGVPTVTYALADNQLEGMRAFERHGLMRSAGDCRPQGAAFAAHALKVLCELLNDAPARTAMAAAMRGAVDGKGAARIATALLALCAE